MNTGVEATPAVNPVVGAEDLSRGARVDIYDDRRDRWFQLCARSAPDAYGENGAAGGYVLGRGRSQVTVPVPPGDEGHVSTVTTADSTPGGSSISTCTRPCSAGTVGAWLAPGRARPR